MFQKIGELQKKVSEKQATLDETMKKLQAIVNFSSILEI
jgi:hypothetical protein